MGRVRLAGLSCLGGGQPHPLPFQIVPQVLGYPYSKEDLKPQRNRAGLCLWLKAPPP